MEHLLARSLGPGQEMDQGLMEWLRDFDRERERWLEEACRIEKLADGVCLRLGLRGTLQLFGSSVTGFGSSPSDVDLVFITAEGAPEPLEALMRLQAYLRATDSCYNLTTIFQPRAPLLKLTDSSGIEVDLVVNNFLGVRNTQLLRAYHDYGPQDIPTGRARTDIMVRAVKEWARRCGLVGTIDGLINSYAWTLMAIYYLQVVEALPNLQLLAESTGQPSVVIEGHETRFVVPEEGQPDPTPASAATAGALLWGFFQFYAFEFDWRSFAVCVRLGRPAPTFVRKSSLHYGDRVPWYIEDPFDRRMNLARGTTHLGRERIQVAIRAAAHQLRQRPCWHTLCPEGFDRPFSQLFLKMRLQEPKSREAVPGAVWNLLAPRPPLRLYVRMDESQVVEVYAQFRTWQDLRTSQSANEQKMPCYEQPVALYISLGYGLYDELDRFQAFSPSLEREHATVHRQELSEIFLPLPFGPTASQPPSFRASPPTGLEPQLVPAGGSSGSYKTMNPLAASFVPSGAAYSSAYVGPHSDGTNETGLVGLVHSGALPGDGRPAQGFGVPSATSDWGFGGVGAPEGSLAAAGAGAGYGAHAYVAQGVDPVADSTGTLGGCYGGHYGDVDGTVPTAAVSHTRIDQGGVYSDGVMPDAAPTFSGGAQTGVHANGDAAAGTNNAKSGCGGAIGLVAAFGPHRRL